MPLTRAYIDGFNLYHGIIRRNRFHWLNLQKFAEQLNGGDPVDQVIFCTAMVSNTPIDPDKANRQDVYHRALSVACPRVEIVKGQFTTHKKMAAMACCENFPTCMVRVSIRTEKGSDVNLASRLLHDAHLGKFDVAIVVSGDSDLAEPIRLVTQELKKKVLVRNPRDTHSHELNRVASSYSSINQAVLRSSQLPNPVTDGTKTYHTPSKWLSASPPSTKGVTLTATCSLVGCGKTVEAFRYI